MRNGAGGKSSGMRFIAVDFRISSWWDLDQGKYGVKYRFDVGWQQKKDVAPPRSLLPYKKIICTMHVDSPLFTLVTVRTALEYTEKSQPFFYILLK